MTDEVNDKTHVLSGFNAELAEASAALRNFARGAGEEAAGDLSAAFTRAGARIGEALVRAGREGEISFQRLAQTVLETFAQIALDRLFQGPGGGGNGGDKSAGAVAVNFFMGGSDASGVMRHQGQIAAGIARAVSYGKRNL